MAPLLLFLLISLAIQFVLFIPAFLFKTDKLTDLSYSLTFLLLVGIAFFSTDFSWQALILFSMIALWALRLGTYLFIRILFMGKDKRFDEYRDNFLLFLRFWVLQGLTVWVVLLSSFLFFNQTPRFTILSLIGLLVWLAGFIIESFADAQKFVFIRSKKNVGRWIHSGLWAYSRHPNYFGEILCWLGVFLFVVSSLSLTQSLIAFISPLFIAIILIFGTGLPPLEKSADKKWGHNSAYRKYKKETSILVLWPKKK